MFQLGGICGASCSLHLLLSSIIYSPVFSLGSESQQANLTEHLALALWFLIGSG